MLPDSTEGGGWWRANALNPKCPLQHDTDRTVRDIMHMVWNVATTYRAAEQQENWIYTHYEGWLPPEDELPTNQWLSAWSANHLLHAPTKASPLANLQFPLPITTPGASPHPTYDIHHPAVAARIGGRIQQLNSY